jgi:hypothetical protein
MSFGCSHERYMLCYLRCRDPRAARPSTMALDNTKQMWPPAGQDPKDVMNHCYEGLEKSRSDPVPCNVADCMIAFARTKKG